MPRILKREQFSPVTFLWEIEAPDIARAARPGHFVIVKHGERGERVPLTIADFDKSRGTITIVVQAVGKSTRMFMTLPQGSNIDVVVGPLGRPREFEPHKKVVFIGGGLGIAPVYPQLRHFKTNYGGYTISIIGFRTKDFVFWEDRFKEYSDELWISTDDGSYGEKGIVTDLLKKVLEKHNDIDEVTAIGPIVMMKAVVDITKPLGLKTMVSLNPIMVDGSGMCGCCRVTVGGKLKFACVDGPDFNGLEVDFDELLARSRQYYDLEQISLKKWEEECKLEKAYPELR